MTLDSPPNDPQFQENEVMGELGENGISHPLPPLHPQITPPASPPPVLPSRTQVLSPFLDLSSCQTPVSPST